MFLFKGRYITYIQQNLFKPAIYPEVMVEGKKRSRTFRRVKIRIPSGKVKTHYRKRKPAKAQCGSCGAILKGVARTNSRNISKSAKRPSRPFGGHLCSKCSRGTIVSKFRKLLME